MQKNRLKRFLTGVKLAKEYPCVDYEQLRSEVKVLMISGDKETDITNDHVFLGYKPVIVGIYLPQGYDMQTREIRIRFVHHTGKKLGYLVLKEFERRQLGDRTFVLLTGLYAKSYMLSFIFRVSGSIIRGIRKRIPGNIELEGNEYRQVQVMYTIPRKISVISTGSGGLFNMFPTDLHGNIGKGFYVDSLRKAGKACMQVLEIKKIVKTDVELSFMADAYAMGKNHIRDLADVDHFPAQGYSEIYHFPLPSKAIAYKELELYDHVETGIHRVLIFKVINEVLVQEGRPVLSCINSHYAQWRINHSLPLNYI